MIRGQKMPEELRRKLSDIQRAAFAAGRANPMSGRSRPDLSKRNRSAKLAPEEAARRAAVMANSNRGRALSQKHRERIALALKGKRKSFAHRIAISRGVGPDERLRRAVRAAETNLKMRTRGTLPERRMALFLASKGVRYVEQFSLPGAPFRFDFAIPSKRVLIEVDGCYWHGCRRCGEPGKPDTIRSDAAKSRLAIAFRWKLIRVKTCEMVSI